jgi:hypothetical protein
MLKRYKFHDFGGNISTDGLQSGQIDNLSLSTWPLRRWLVRESYHRDVVELLELGCSGEHDGVVMPREDVRVRRDPS